MSTYSITNTGKLRDLGQYKFEPEGLDMSLPGKLFLGELIDLTAMEVSLNKDAPNTGTSIFHTHKNNEEVYVFLGGQGEMMLDGEIFRVEEGSVVRVSPESKRAWWNTGKDDLYYIVIQAQQNSLQTATLDDAEIYEEKIPWD